MSIRIRKYVQEQLLDRIAVLRLAPAELLQQAFPWLLLGDAKPQMELRGNQTHAGQHSAVTACCSTLKYS